MSRSPRGRKPPAADERPLDDGARWGPETWRVVESVEFSHWDRWLLRLALSEPQGLSGIESSFRQRVWRADGPGLRSGTEGDEAMLAQVTDLQARLRSISRPAASMLDAEERASEWLLKKAQTRVWQSGPHRRTDAMRRTPRRVLEARAISGNWASFPVSPAPFFSRFKAVFGEGTYFDYRGSGLVTRMFELDVEGALAEAGTDAVCFAVLRDALSVAVVAMEQIDSSLAEMSEESEAFFAEYMKLFPAFAGDGMVLRDILELWVWEDYGLFPAVKEFRAALPAALLVGARAALAEMISELRDANLKWQLGKTESLLRACGHDD